MKRRFFGALGLIVAAIVSLLAPPPAMLRIAHAEAGSPQADAIQVGATVQVVVTALNLREQAGTEYPVVALLNQGEQLQVLDGPASVGSCVWWKVSRQDDETQGWAAERCGLNVYMRIVAPDPDETSPPLPSPSPSRSSAPSPTPSSSPSPEAAARDAVDWRANLTCEPEQQLYDGLLYCTGQDETGQPAHVIVVDLHAAGVSFEVILPTGYSAVHESVGECREPNVPVWGGPEGGCAQEEDAPELYPAISLDEAIRRAGEVRAHSAPAALINGDYGAPDLTHGPEGLLIVRGERLDGAARCDDDFNAALRPWLGLGDGLDEAAQMIRATIDRLPTDSSDPPGWLYTGVGGGPWLIRDGEVLPSAATCAGEKTLETVEPIANCTGNPKPDRTPPIEESYSPGSCRPSSHVAAGLSADQRWLFLVMTTGASHPDTIARFMRDQLGVWQALKFDGGSSSKLMYMAETPVRVESVPGSELTNYLGVYASPGRGIQLPLLAEPEERVYYQIITAGEKARFDIAFKNDGSLTWLPGDQVELQRQHWFLPSRSEPLTLTQPVRPGETMSWAYEVDAEGVTYQRFQMVQKGQPFGTDAAVIVIVLPQEWADRRDELEQELQETVDGWKARGEQELDRLMDEIQKRAERAFQNWLERTISGIREWFSEQSQRSCASVGLTLATLLAAIVVARRLGRK